MPQFRWHHWLLAGALVMTSMASATFAQETRPTMNPTTNQTEEAEFETSAETNPEEIRRGMRLGEQDGNSRRQRYLERVISSVEPVLGGERDRVAAYINHFENELISNPKMFAFNVEGQWKDDTLVLSGYVEFEENHRTLMDYIKYLGFEDVEDRERVLPSEPLQAEKYGFVKSSRAKTYGNPVEPRETMTEDFIGDPLFILDYGEGDTYLVHSSEGYIGYIDAEHVVRVDAERFAEYRSGTTATFMKPFQAGDELTIPAGARLRVVSRGGTDAVMELPTGETVEVPENILEIRAAGPPAEALEAVATAKQLLGTPYVWGGKSETGVDCSGLVQASYKAQGYNLARDAYMQAYAGELTATRWCRETMMPGDLMYFLGSTGRITHTAIYIGDDLFIEATSPVAKISSLDPEHPDYSARRDRGFCFAKRVVA